RKKTFLGSQTVLGNLSIGSEAIVDAQTHTISVAGNWAHLGTSQFIHDGSVYFTGAGSQLVTMLPSLGKFNILRVEKSLGTVLTLNTDIAVQRHIYFLENGGNLDLENHTLTFGGDFYIRKGCDFDWTTGAKLIANGATEDQLIRNYNPATTYPTFEFTGGGIKRLYENPFYFEGNIKIDNATLRGEHFDHYIKGNFVNTGGTFQHSRILYFNGLDQEIDAATFNNVYFTGVGTKRLKGNIIVGGSVTIDTSAVLDVSPDGGTTSYDITIDAHWNNNLFNEDSTKTGIFIPRKGSVIFSGNHSNIYTGDSIKADHTGRNGKQFYNLTINNRDNNTWTRLYPSYGAAADIRVANDVRVLNNFTLEQGLFYTYWNKMYVGGSFENQGGNFQMNTHYTTYPELYFEGNSSGSYSLDPGEIHLFRRVEFLGTGEYKMKRDWNIDRSFTYPNLVVSAGKLVLNHNALSVMSTVTGDITIGASGEMIIDSLAELKIPQTRTLTNNGTFRIVGTASGPAVMRCHTSGANRYYFYKQYGGTTHAKYYSIENTDGYGMDFLGGAIDEVNNFTDGQFSGGRLINDASAYITLRNGAISIPNNHTLKNVLFYSGAHKNIIRETNTGAGIITFENASGPVSGVAHEVDPDNKVEWTYPGAKYWTGLAADDNWNSAKNWSDSLVPDENSQVYLDNSKVTGSYIVNIQADALAKYLNITATETTLNLNGAKLNVNNNIQIGAGNTLTQTTPTDTIFVGGSWSNSGTFNPNSSVVVFTPTNGTYSLSPRAGDTFNHLVVRGANGTLTLATDIEVTGHIKCESGVLYGANRTLKVSGNWSAGFDIFDGGTGTVLFSGNDGVAQTIDGGTFNHVTFEGSSEKQARSTLKINGDVRINIGAVFNGGKESIRAGRYWYNYAGASGFMQSGIGTVIFDGTGTKFIGDYYGNPINTKRTVFNNLSFVGAGTKYIADSITIKGNLKNNIGSNVYVGSAGATATAITGTSGGTFSMDGGVMYLLGINSFPQNFGSYNLTNSTVEYRGSTAQTVAAGSQIHYHNLNLRTLTTPDSTATGLMKKTVTDDLHVENQVYVINQHAGYDKPTQLVMNDHDMYLGNSLVIQDSVNVSINQIDWGTGTFYHTGAGLTLNANVKEFNNFIKKGTGAINLSNTIKVHGYMTFEDNTNLNMRDYAIVCDGED
ncbi:MAG: hypothetical protein RBR35_18375, partial [Salinivirgaceae bacterium]|nr:hypothetical protein [Salinivirgaceae bacterium]